MHARNDARAWESEALRRIAAIQLEEIAIAMDCDKSTVSRMVSGDRGLKLAEIPLLLGAIGYKVVGKDRVCIDRKVYESFKTIATAALSNPRTLNWDEDD